MIGEQPGIARVVMAAGNKFLYFCSQGVWPYCEESKVLWKDLIRELTHHVQIAGELNLVITWGIDDAWRQGEQQASSSPRGLRQ